MSVITTKTATTATLRASTAGSNCTFAIHPSHGCNVPVKSRKSTVMAIRNINPIVIRIFRSIPLFYFLPLTISNEDIIVLSQYITKVLDASYFTKHNDIKYS